MKTMPLVLLHAFPLASAMWRPQRLGLSAFGMDIFTPDQRGMGGGAEPGPYTLDDAADDVAHLLDRSGLGRVVLGGLSMGGYVALRFLARHPDRLAGLVLSDTKATADSPDVARARAELAARVRFEGSQTAVAANLPKLLGKHTHEEAPELVGFVRALGDSRPKEAVARALEAMACRPDSTPDLAKSQVPVLVLVGEDDALTPVADAEALVRAAPRARLRRLPRAGHLSNLEAAPEWNRHVLSSFSTRELPDHDETVGATRGRRRGESTTPGVASDPGAHVAALLRRRGPAGLDDGVDTVVEHPAVVADRHALADRQVLQRLHGVDLGVGERGRGARGHRGPIVECRLLHHE
ncbi:MAG: alpha/beta hydrolase [Myxococcales bacterium]|nr:alpha/beta hydrolase [Myxococcales bacterium]